MPEPIPPVSVLVPTRGETALLLQALGSIMDQDYEGATEVIVADGSYLEARAQAIRAQFPEVRVIPNPKRNAAAGLNRALQVAAHAIIVRCDARCRLPADYVRQAVKTLRHTSAANVGGRQCPVGTTPFERAVGLAMTTSLGAGGARYRLGGAAGPVDTVYLGVFRRAPLEAAGGFDATLDRNQDYELNWRLRRRGEVVWFDPALAVAYRPRGSLPALARQYFEFGRWKRVVLRRHPASLRGRQLAPPLLLAGLAGSAVLAVATAFVPAALKTLVLGAAALAPLAYLLLLAGGSACIGLRRRSAAAVLLPLVLATMHLCWGVGFLCVPAPPGARR